jgi:hypothetical protein
MSDNDNCRTYTSWGIFRPRPPHRPASRSPILPRILVAKRDPIRYLIDVGGTDQGSPHRSELLPVRANRHGLRRLRSHRSPGSRDGDRPTARPIPVARQKYPPVWAGSPISCTRRPLGVRLCSRWHGEDISNVALAGLGCVSRGLYRGSGRDARRILRNPPIVLSRFADCRLSGLSNCPVFL